MATSKTVNVTTGKVLHYTFSKQGYKTVNGSKLITQNQTISINMIPESSADGVYTFGDRIGGVATFFTYFDSVNPNTSLAQKYAVFVLDAKYRNSGAYWGEWNTDTVLPNYGSASYALNAKESATYNTQTIFDNYTVGTGAGQWAAFYYARNPNGTPLIISVDGTNYSPQLPNAYEVSKIADFRTQLDALDPTLVDGTGTISLASLTASGKGMWTSNEYDSQYAFAYTTSLTSIGKSNNMTSVSVFEIPVN